MSLVNVHWAVVSTTGSLHHIFLSHHLFTGRRKIFCDGSLCVDEQRFVDAGSTHAFPLTPSNVNHREKHVDVVDIKIQSCRMGTAYRYDVLVNQLVFDQHNLKVAKHLRIFLFPKMRKSQHENNTTTLISCMLPDIVHVYKSEWPTVTAKFTEVKEHEIEEPPPPEQEPPTQEQTSPQVSVKGTADEEKSISSQHSCLRLVSELGFSMDDEFQGVVHDCVLPHEEEEEEEEEKEKKEAQHFHLYSDVMRDIQLIQLKDKVDLHVPSMTFATLIQMYPEFKEPTCHRALKKSGQKGTKKKKKGITRWSKK